MLCAGGFPQLVCLGRWRAGGSFSVCSFTDTCPIHLIFIPDNTIEWGRAGVIGFPLLMRKPGTTEQTGLGCPPEVKPDFVAIFFPLCRAGTVRRALFFFPLKVFIIENSKTHKSRKRRD